MTNFARTLALGAASLAALTLAACSTSDSVSTTLATLSTPAAASAADASAAVSAEPAPALPAAQPAPTVTSYVGLPPEAAGKLAGVLMHERRAGDLARDEWRHPQETLAFFGVTPEMTVVEALPGGGWYTRVLLPYVHGSGRYMAINYPMSLFEQLFGERLTPERRASLEAWDQTFLTEGAANGPDGAVVSNAFRFGAVPAEVQGTADAVLYIRALHNLARYGMLPTAVADAYAMLKPGGVLGVVQHRARPDAPIGYVTGEKGYLREADVILAFQDAGFVLEATAEINANPKDTADHEGGVWELPPAARGETVKTEIGESDRMTLRFRKPL